MFFKTKTGKWYVHCYICILWYYIIYLSTYLQYLHICVFAYLFIYLSTYLLISYCIYLLIYLLIYFFTYLLIFLKFISLLVYLNLLIYMFAYLLIYLVTDLLIYCLFTHLLIYLLIYLFIYLLIYFFTYLLIYFCTYLLRIYLFFNLFTYLLMHYVYVHATCIYIYIHTVAYHMPPISIAGSTRSPGKTGREKTWQGDETRVTSLEKNPGSFSYCPLKWWRRLYILLYIYIIYIYIVIFNWHSMAELNQNDIGFATRRGWCPCWSTRTSPRSRPLRVPGASDGTGDRKMGETY
jgi:hypothetical protein